MKARARRVVSVLLLCAAYGVLMGTGRQLKETWAKLLLGALAGAVMGVTLVTIRRR